MNRSTQKDPKRHGNNAEPLRKPEWLDKKLHLSSCHGIKSLLKDLGLYTVCEEASCPNISECFASGVATFLILGDTCTRRCRFCGIKKGTPQRYDEGEPSRVSAAITKLGLRHAVITSVTRDDLDDGGAEMFKRTVAVIRSVAPEVTIELLISDLQGDRSAIRTVASSGADIIAHNVETVPRLYADIRPGADYQRSLGVLKALRHSGNPAAVKSGFMVGLGETSGEILQVMEDLVACGCEFLSIGQYLAPSREHTPVKEFVHPSMFTFYGQKAKELGFRHCESGPYVRSSYLAHKYMHADCTDERALTKEVPAWNA